MNRIDDLPNEVLGKILERLSPSDLRKAIQISARWRSVIDELVGVHKYVGEDTQMWPGEIYEPVNTLDDFGIQNLAISNLNEGSEQVPELKYPFLLHDLWIDDWIQPSTLSRLLAPVINLRSLILHVSTFGQHIFTKENFILSVPSLVSFTISLYGVGHQQAFITQFFEDRKIANLIAILDSANLPSLKNLSLHLPLVPVHEQLVASAVVSIIAKHKASLEKLLVNFEFTTPVRRPGFLEGEAASYPIYEEEEAERLVTGLHLKKLFVHCARRSRTSMNAYHHILSEQEGTLQKLHLTTGYHQLPTQVIERNCEFLTAIQLTVTSTDGQPLDFYPLANCTRLKILTLVGPPKTELPLRDDGERSLRDIRSTRPDFLNVRTSLPPSLEAVRIFNLYLASDDADFIVRSLPAVKLVSLHQIGTTAELGLRLSSIAHIMDHKQILFFTTICGLNLASLTSNPDHEIENPFACLAGLLLKSMEPCGFMLQLDADGKTYNFGTEVNPSLPVTTDPKVIIDAEVNIDFAIENDDLFEADGDIGNGPVIFGGGDDDDDDNIDDDFQDDWDDEEDPEDEEAEMFGYVPEHVPMQLIVPHAPPHILEPNEDEEAEEGHGEDLDEEEEGEGEEGQQQLEDVGVNNANGQEEDDSQEDEENPSEVSDAVRAAMYQHFLECHCANCGELALVEEDDDDDDDDQEGESEEEGATQDAGEGAGNTDQEALRTTMYEHFLEYHHDDGHGDEGKGDKGGAGGK